MLDFEGHLNRCDVYAHVEAPGMNMVDETMRDEGDLQGFEVQGSRCGLEVVGGAGFFFTGFALDARASKGETNSNIDLRGDGGRGWETGSG